MMNMRECHRVKEVQFEGDILIFEVDERVYRVDVKSISERLAQADQIERDYFEVSPSGYGIHWPLIDEDLTIDGLIEAAMRFSSQVKVMEVPKLGFSLA